MQSRNHIYGIFPSKYKESSIVAFNSPLKNTRAPLLKIAMTINKVNRFLAVRKNRGTSVPGYSQSTAGISHFAVPPPIPSFQNGL
jgi:hypothetical protein